MSSVAVEIVSTAYQQLSEEDKREVALKLFGLSLDSNKKQVKPEIENPCFDLDYIKSTLGPFLPYRDKTNRACK